MNEVHDALADEACQGESVQHHARRVLGASRKPLDQPTGILDLAFETPAFAQDECTATRLHDGFGHLERRQFRTARVETRDDLGDGCWMDHFIHSVISAMIYSQNYSECCAPRRVYGRRKL